MKAIIFGAGYHSYNLIKSGSLKHMDIVAICDNDIHKQGTFLNDIEVIAPDRICEFKYDYIFISPYRFYDEIKLQLVNEFGIDSQKIDRLEIKTEKYIFELAFWEERYQKENNSFANHFYKKRMLDIAEEENDLFWSDKVVADFGCGPRGSLAWTNTPAVKLGIDVLAEQYLYKFGDELIKHQMVYVCSSENKIPVPSNFVDYLCTINSLDHVTNLKEMTAELLRILKPGGVMLGSFNLNEPYSACEPQTLTEDLLQRIFLKHFDVLSYKIAYKDSQNAYINLENNNLLNSLDNRNAPLVLWVKGKKKTNL